MREIIVDIQGEKTPKTYAYTLLEWIKLHWREMLKTSWKEKRIAWFSAYAENTKDPQEVHFLFIAWFYKTSATYRAYINRVLAHEHKHCLRGDAEHHKDERDVMGTTFGDNLGDLEGMQDEWAALKDSAPWRAAILKALTARGMASTGSPEPETETA